MHINTIRVTIGMVYILKHVVTTILLAFITIITKKKNTLLNHFYLNLWTGIHTLGPEKILKFTFVLKKYKNINKKL